MILLGNPNYDLDRHTVNQKDLFKYLKMGQFRWIKYSFISWVYLAPLNKGQYSPIT